MIDRVDKAMLALQSAAVGRKLYGLDHPLPAKQTDLATAAGVFRAAIDRRGPYEADVALGLAELLHRHRHHPDVRPAFRQWTWSGRRWAALLSFSLADGRRAA